MKENKKERRESSVTSYQFPFLFYYSLTVFVYVQPVDYTHLILVVMQATAMSGCIHIFVRERGGV
jgi:hypothetical protein